MSNKAMVERLCRKYDTRDPFKLAAMQNIQVVHEPLGDIRGYYNYCLRQRWIHINQSNSEESQRFTCAHELGHALLHKNISTPFLRAHTFFSVDKLEIEANRFALDLLYSDDDLEEYIEQPITVIASVLCIPVELAQYRMNSVRPSLPDWRE